jgi:hypothetical protein
MDALRDGGREVGDGTDVSIAHNAIYSRNSPYTSQTPHQYRNLGKAVVQSDRPSHRVLGNYRHIADDMVTSLVLAGTEGTTLASN